MPPRESTATSVVPPPISTTIDPVGSVTGRPAPIAAAIGSSMRKTRRAPALSADSWMARRSAEHHLRFVADRQDLLLALDAGDRDDRRLVEDDPPTLHIDQGICGTEVDCHIGGKQAQHSSYHVLFRFTGCSVSGCWAGRCRGGTASGRCLHRHQADSAAGAVFALLVNNLLRA